ncbi:uncharacterized protein LOC130986914 [Salvia miltiorrhiza]|uniref:uncharacterized protein LOC130986914 n=1 Tax=Salvia miltiorrhiza TaxID=226208 RepID=UPI0025AD3529|nr:uncharacterized protein LOC130986914 [Salvia miltiorrhiza]
MAPEEQHIVSSTHSGDRSRNVKQKKIPQRGLGVAQLEKIRVEEQRKKETANALPNNAIASATDATLSPSPVNFRSPSLPVQMNGSVEDAASWCRLWNGDYNHRNDNAAEFRPPVNLQSESNAALPQRFFRFQRPASPVVNPSSPSASSHMEPPSNQNMHNIHCNSYASSSSSWPEEYKMVGVKRSYPFSLESPPAGSFNGHFDPSSVASKSRRDELPSCGSGYAAVAARTEPRNVYMRDGPSNLPEDDGRLNGNFLTLAPPPWNSKHTYATDNPESQGPEENETRQVHHWIASRSREEPFSFFPVRADESDEEKGETIDLNLKL